MARIFSRNGGDVKPVQYSKSALRALRKMTANDAKKIISKCQQFAQDPASRANNVKALSGSDYLRLRVGDWRVIMDDRGAVLAILIIAARGSVN